MSSRDHKIINQVSQSLRCFKPHPVSNHLTTDTSFRWVAHLVWRELSVRRTTITKRRDLAYVDGCSVTQPYNSPCFQLTDTPEWTASGSQSFASCLRIELGGQADRKQPRGCPCRNARKRSSRNARSTPCRSRAAMPSSGTGNSRASASDLEADQGYVACSINNAC